MKKLYQAKRKVKSTDANITMKTNAFKNDQSIEVRIFLDENEVFCISTDWSGESWFEANALLNFVDYDDALIGNLYGSVKPILGYVATINPETYESLQMLSKELSDFVFDTVSSLCAQYLVTE